MGKAEESCVRFLLPCLVFMKTAPKVPVKLTRIFIIFFVFLMSCAPRSIKKEKIIIGIDHSPTEINPLTTDSSISANLINLVFDPLFICSENGDLFPNIAKQWRWSEDGLLLNIELREDVYFHDQYPVSAADVLFTYKYLKENKVSAHSHYLSFIKEIRALDKHHLEILLTQNDYDFKTALCEFGIAPEHLLNNVSSFSKFNEHPVGSGPYRFLSQNSEIIILEKNENYFQKLDSLDRIEVKVYPDQKSALNHLIMSDVDMMFLTNPEDYGSLEKISSIQLYNNWYPRIYLLGFNHKNDLFKDVSVRRAINLAIDKEKLIHEVTLNKGYIAKGTLVPDTREYISTSSGDLMSFDPKESLKILKNKGWKESKDLILMKNGKKFEFTITTFDGENLALATLKSIQKQLRDLGIVMKIESLPLDQYIKRVMRDTHFESYMINYVARPFYNNDFSFWHSSQINNGMNFSRYQNVKVDHLLEEMRSETDREKRGKLNLELQHEFINSPPGVFLFWRKMPIAVNKRFYNVPEKRMQNLRDIIHFKVH